MSKLQRYRLVADTPRTGLARLIDHVRGLWMGPFTTGSPDFERLFTAPPSRTGVTVNEHVALTYSAFWACVNGISTDVGASPLIHYKREKGGGKTRYTDSRLYRLLHDEPNPEMTSITFRQTLTAHALSWGNGYAEIELDVTNRPLALWPLTPGRVAPYRDRTGSIAYLVRRADGAEDSVPAAQMLHIPGLGFDGVMGYSVVQKARESIGLALAAEQFGSTFYGNGMTFGGTISYQGPKPPELSEKNYRDTLEGNHQGVDRAHKILALYNGAKYEKGGGIPPNDAQFLETRLHQIEEMCRWFRMPPHKIQHLLRATNNNIEHQGIEYYTDTLRPWMVRWEQEINRKLISPSERRIQFVEHMIDGVLRGDLPSRYAAYAIGRQWGWLSADDVCEKENMNPLPNGTGKIYLLPLNMTPADRITELIDAQIAAKKQPPTPPPSSGGGDPIQHNALAMIEAIRGALAEAQQRADASLARAVAAETAADEQDEAARQAELDQARAAALDAATDVGSLKALLLEATERADREQQAREAAIADATRAHAKHAKATVHITTAQAALAEAEGKRQASEGNLDQALAQAALAEARAATLIEEARTAREAAEAFALEAATQHADTSRHFLAANAAKDQLAAQVVELERRAVEAAAAAAAAAIEHAAALEAATQARATAESASLETTAARMTLAEREADVIAADQRTAAEVVARTSVEAAGAAQHAAERLRMTAVIGAHRGLIADAMGRMIRRETEKARRAQATPAKLRAWVENFYEIHREVCVDALLPAMRAHLAWSDSADDPTTATEQIVRVHIDESIRQLRAVAETDPIEDFPAALERVLGRWELHRADECADGILKEAIDHVSHDQR